MRLVGRSALGTEHGLVGKVRIHCEGAHLIAGPLGIEGDTDPLVGLNAQGDDIRPKLLVRRARKERLWRALEVHTNFGELASQTLTSPNVERYTGPAPVIDIKLDGRVRFGCGVGVYVRLLAVTRDFLATDLTWTVLPADSSFRHLVHGHRPDGSQHLHFLLTYRIGVESDG